MRLGGFAWCGLAALALSVACGDSGVGGSGGSGGTGAGGAGGDDVYPACPVQRVDDWDGVKIVACEQAFTEPPFIHLPPDTDTARFVEYRVHPLEGGVTIDRGGVETPVTDGSFDGEEERRASLLYEVETESEMVVCPFVLIEEPVFFQTFMLGATFDGLIAARLADGSFELTPTIPIRLRVVGVEMDDTGRYGGTVEIENLLESVTAADGSCVPSLESAGEANPFFGAAQADASFTRVANMHQIGDDHLVLGYRVDGVAAGSTMSPDSFFFPSYLMSPNDPPFALDHYEGSPHGNPTSIPAISLDRALGGGEPCTP
ncbi:MAG: hypothetical protein U0271_18965 [Polyangiaceae bacterium]